MTQDERWLLNEKYNGEITESFRTDCDRLARGEPLAYVIGWVPFLNTKIYLDSHPLIPRTETEYWVEKIIHEILNTRTYTAPRILDLCAGSGCIGTAVLNALPLAQVDFAEINPTHHPTIQKNILENNLDHTHTHIYGGNLFEHVTGTYDYILTNPPYIDPAHDRSDPDVRTYEPHEALYGGADGYTYIAQIITDASRFLRPHGTLVIEHEPERGTRINHDGAQAYVSVETHKDQFDVPRYTILRLS